MSKPKGKGKAGVSWPVQELTSDPLAVFFQHGSVGTSGQMYSDAARKLNEQSLSWHWNWNKNWDVILPQTTKGLKLDAVFVPMIFAPGYFANEFELQDGCAHIMGYNEPDMDNPAVAQLCSPEEAAKQWARIADLRRTRGLKLVSPAVAHDKQWMQRFLSLVPAYQQPDYLAIHVYTTTFDSFRSQVESYWTTFGLPIWVTEFAMTSFDPNVPPPSSMQQIHDFMGQTTKWLDEMDYIARYSWFGACRDQTNLHGVHPFNRLMDEQGQLTALGQQYVNGGHD